MKSVLRLFGIQNVSLWLLRFCRLEHWLPEYRFDYIMHYTHRKSRICKSSRWRVLPCPYLARPGFSTPPGSFSFMHVHVTSKLYFRNSDATELTFKTTNYSYIQLNRTVNTYRYSLLLHLFVAHCSPQYDLIFKEKFLYVGAMVVLTSLNFVHTLS